MSDNQKKFDELSKLIAEWREELGVPGTVVGISFGDEEFSYGSGVTSVDNPLQTHDETLFQIGSITKTFTATAMMSLVEDGKLDLNAPIQKYLPDFHVKDAGVSSKATVKHLITHSAGWIGDVFSDTGTNDDSLKIYVEQMASLDQLAPPDRLFSYNNSAFCVAGRVIEAVTGKVYETAMQELIFEPLGLQHCFFFPKDVMTYRFAVGHRVSEEETKVLRPWPIPRSSNPAGGISCHIKDLLAYGRFHMGDGSPILKQDTLDLMHSPQFRINDENGSIGLAWFVGDVNGTKTLQHGGGTLGQISQLLLVPEHNFAFGMLTNADEGGDLIRKAEKWALKEFLGLEDSEPQAIDATPEQLAAYVGRFSRPIMDTELRMEDGKLMLQVTLKGGIPQAEMPPPPPPATVAICGDDQMLVMDGPFKDARIEFIRDKDNEIEYLRLGLRINPRMKE
jgi:CubicO group peptidase (beta-lactamase class C family)